jgi:hypothetical protein
LEKLWDFKFSKSSLEFLRIHILEYAVEQYVWSDSLIAVSSLVSNNMYSLSKSCVCIHKTITDFFHITVGVKQGDNLSPNLFNIFSNDLPESLRSTPDPFTVNLQPIYCLMYAGDFALLSISANGLQKKTWPFKLIL